MSDLPTPQAIHDARAYMVEGYRRSVGPLTTPEAYREAGDGLAQLLGVFAFAEECRAAQVDCERVPWAKVDDGYYLVVGDVGGNPKHVRIKTHPECGPTVWGLSLWGPELHTKTWGYRTLGISLASFRERWPDAVLLDDYDRTQEGLPEQFREGEARPEIVCPTCGADEVDAFAPVTVYACGSMDYDQRPGTFTLGAECDSRVADSLSTNPPEVETPEDAGDDGPDDGDGWIAWENFGDPGDQPVAIEVEDRMGGIHWCEPGSLVFVMMKAGIAMADIVRYRLAQPSQPTTDPEARVRAMSDEEVEVALTERGVGPWILAVPSENLHDRDWLDPSPFVAITLDGALVNSAGQFLDRDLGDTTTPEGRAECSRRLLVHLLREEGANG